MKKKWILLGATALILLGLGGGTLLLNDDEQDDKSSLDKSIEQVSDANYDKAVQSVEDLKESDQEKNINLYKTRIKVLEKERQLIEEKRYSEARDLIKKHLEKHPVSEDEKLDFQLMLVEDLDKIDQLNNKEIKAIKAITPINKALEANRKGEYDSSKKILDKLSKEDKDSKKEIVSKLEESNEKEISVDKELGEKEKELSDILINSNQGVSIITQLKSDTSDNKDRGLVDVKISLLIKNETKSSLVVDPEKFLVNNHKINNNTDNKTIHILPGTSYLLEDILTDAQPDQLSGELSYDKKNLGKLVDVERGYFEDERWVQL